jgi:hypothetical protein
MAVMALGCQGAGAANSPLGSAPVLSVAPSSVINFGNIPLQSTVSKTISLTNSSSSPLLVSGLGISGPSAFTLANWSGSTSLDAGASLSVDVAFTPSEAQSYSATLTVEISPDLMQQVSLAGTGDNPNAVSVSISPTSATLPTDATQQFTATVTGTTNTSVTWWVNGVEGGNSTFGTVSARGLYTAPASVPGSGTVSVAARSVADTTKMASASVTITTAAIRVTISPATATVQTSLTQQFTAKVTGTTNNGVYWIVNGVSGGNATVGTISTSGLYTAPASVPSGGVVTVGARSAADTTKSGNAAVTITGSGGGGNNYYVATTGSDSNDGSSAHPWATITHADSVVAPGDTVHVEPGTYYENPSTAANGNSSGQITFLSDTQWGAVIKGSADSVWYATGNYVTIAGFEITSTNPATRLGILTYGSHGDIVGNKIHDIVATAGSTGNGGAGISPNNNQSGSAADYTVVDSNFIYNIAVGQPGWYIHGVYVNGCKYTVVSNNIIINVAAGLAINTYHSPVSNATIMNNTLLNNYGGIDIGSDGTGSNVTDYNYVANNIVAYTGPNDDGIRECCSGSNIGSHNTYTNNLVYKNSSNYGFYNSDYAQNPIMSNPDFVNYTGDYTGDYHLQSGSPAIDAGVSTNAPATDFEGGTRPVNNLWDVGAYEYGATPGTWPWL